MKSIFFAPYMPCAARNGRRFPLALRIAWVVLGMMLGTAPIRVSAQTTTRVYLYTSSGFVEVTNSTFYQGARVFVAYGGGVFEVALDYEEGHVYDLAAEVVRDRIENTEMAALYPWQEERMENTGWCWRDATTIDVHVSGNGK